MTNTQLHNILCPVDFSDTSNAALQHASALAKQYNATLHIVYVHDEPAPYLDGGFVAVPPAIDLQPEKDRLDKVRPTEDDVLFQRQFLIGDAGLNIVRYADDENVDLIVMGTHGRTGLGRLLMGSVAENVLRKAPCPVLTIRAKVFDTSDAEDATSETQVQ